MSTDLRAAEDLTSRLEGRTIVWSAFDIDGIGFHVALDDGNILTITWENDLRSFIVGLFRPKSDHTLQ